MKRKSRANARRQTADKPVSGLTPSYEGALDTPTILCYITIKD